MKKENTKEINRPRKQPQRNNKKGKNEKGK